MHPDKKISQFNMIIAGTGGQGLITLLQIIAEAALFEGLDIRTSELHGLSQRGGSVEVHIKLGKKIYSPLIPQGRADLILGLEMQETLREVKFASQKTSFLVNKKIIPVPLVKNLTEAEALKSLKKVSKNVTLLSASETCKEKLGTDVVSGIYLISFAVFKGLIPIKSTSIEKAIRKIIPARHLELNLKTFNLAKS
jgi:indolepyruvate ferredoxin oxidoreductase beta subunit